MSTTAKLVTSVVITLVVVAMVVGAALVGAGLGGDDGFVIDRFERDVAVQPDGSLEVVETIAVTFTEPRRGIFRDLEGAGPAGSPVRYTIDGVDAGDEAAPWTYREERTDAGDPRVRIGDASVELDPGPQTYRLRYRIDRLLFRPEARPDQVQVRLDIPGDQWPTEVGATVLRVSLPGSPTSVACVAGAAGTTGACGESLTEGSTVTQPIGELARFETATVAVEFPAEALGAAADQLPVEDVTELDQRAPFASLGVPLVPATLIMLVLLIAPAALLEFVRARRVYRDEVTDPHLHDRVAPTAELAPPDGRAPVELAAPVLRPVGSDALLATLIDLEIRGVVATTTSEDGERITVGPGSAPETARPWEARALEALCPGGRPITFDGEYDETTSDRSDAALQVLSQHSRGTFHDDERFLHTGGGILRGGGYVLFVLLVLAVGVAVGLASLAVLDVPLLAVVVAWVGLAVTWLTLALMWGRERLPLTSEGRDLMARSGAFKHFLEEVHADRLEFAAGQEGIGTAHPAVALLPYAMVFGLADSWLERFEPLMVEATQRGQAGGVGPDPWFAHPATLAAVTASHSASTTAPSDSSGGGGSFGGGGAGSGGGGGGGGSW